MDAESTVVNRVNFVCSSCHFQMHSSYSVRYYISLESCHKLVRNLILTRLNYYNSQFTRLSEQKLPNESRMLPVSLFMG